ncbi:MAG: HAD family phosphatase [Nitrospirota bacterium]
MLKAVLFDFGGVIAEEGFREGLRAIARKAGRDPERAYEAGAEAVYDTGYVVGKGDEVSFWAEFRRRTRIEGTAAAMREEVLGRFVLRLRVLELAHEVRQAGLTVGILSDQTDWLEELNERSPFYRHFDYVFNSYRMGKGKRDPGLFRDVARQMGLAPEEVLFIDDKEQNVERARSEGFQASVFKGEDALGRELHRRLSPKPAH